MIFRIIGNLGGLHMFKISNHICNELKDSKVIVKKIDMNERKEILNSILKKYINTSSKALLLWEKFIHYEALSDDIAWSYIKDFVKDNECIIFFNQEEEKEMFLIKSGKDLNCVLSETYGFEFYITNKECSYLLCFNHHNILYGCGNAEMWIIKLRNAMELK